MSSQNHHDIRQWDVVWIQVRPGDKDRHPAVVLSPDVIIRQGMSVNLLIGTTKRPNKDYVLHATLNGADGLDWQTAVNCRIIHLASLSECSAPFGSVTGERRKQIAQLVFQAFGFAW